VGVLARTFSRCRCYGALAHSIGWYLLSAAVLASDFKGLGADRRSGVSTATVRN